MHDQCNGDTTSLTTTMMARGMCVPADAATVMMTRGADVYQAENDREVTRRNHEQDTQRQEKVCY